MTSGDEISRIAAKRDKIKNLVANLSGTIDMDEAQLTYDRHI
jgi:hypothetical protein